MLSVHAHFHDIFPIRLDSDGKECKVAGAIAKSIQEGKKVECQVIGAAAVNQAVKALIIARGFVATSGLNLSFIPAFVDIELDNELKSGIKFVVIVN